MSAPTYNPPTVEGFALHRAGQCGGVPRWCEWCAMTFMQRSSKAHEIGACGPACVLCAIEERRPLSDDEHDTVVEQLRRRGTRPRALDEM